MCQNRIHSTRGSNNALISTRTLWMKKKRKKKTTTYLTLISRSCSIKIRYQTFSDPIIVRKPSFRVLASVLEKNKEDCWPRLDVLYFFCFNYPLSHLPLHVHLVCPFKFCITLAFNFSWVLQSFQEKLKTTFMQKIWEGKTRCTCCTFYRLKANLFYSKWRNLRVWRHFRVILFNQTELNMGGKTRNIAFQLLL